MASSDTDSAAAARALREILQAEVGRRESQKDPGQLRDVVPWDEWIADEYYSGVYSEDLWPFWKSEIADFIDCDYPEWVITGSLGGGKSMCGRCYLVRKAYELSCYKYPQRKFGLGRVSEIIMAYLGATGEQAGMGFPELVKEFDTVPYFKERAPRNTYISGTVHLKSINTQIVQGTGRTGGSRALGTNLFVVMLDEANFYRKSGSSAAGDVELAKRTYGATLRRRLSRFAKKMTDPSKSLLVSSVDCDLSFTEQRIAEAQRNGERQKVTVTNPWLAQPAGTFSDKTFFVFTGTDESDPEGPLESPMEAVSCLSRVVGGSELTAVHAAASAPGATVKSFVDALPASKRLLFLEIPEDFKMSFVQDLVGAIKDTAGKTTKAVGKLFTSRSAWRAATMAVPELSHPFVSPTVCISQDRETTLQMLFRPEVLFDPDTKMFRRHPYAQRFAHVDASETHCPTGIAMFHQAGVKTYEGAEGILPSLMGKVAMPIVEADFYLRITPPEKPDRISQVKIVDFWLWLIREWRVNFGCISMDIFASNTPLEVLKANKVPTELVSMDSNYEYWHDGVSMLHDGRLNLYPYGPLEDELFSLVDDRARKKVVRGTGPSGSTEFKDVVDAVFSAIHTCVSRARYAPPETPQQLAESRLKLVGRRRAANPTTRELAWVVGDYRSPQGQHVDVSKLEVDGELEVLDRSFDGGRPE